MQDFKQIQSKIETEDICDKFKTFLSTFVMPVNIDVYKNFENKFTLYEDLSPNDVLSITNQYLLYFGNDDKSYYFFYVDFDYSVNTYKIYDCMEIPINCIDKNFNISRSGFLFDNGTTQQLYKRVNVNFIKLFREGRVKFYGDETY